MSYVLLFGGVERIGRGGRRKGGLVLQGSCAAKREVRTPHVGILLLVIMLVHWLGAATCLRHFYVVGIRLLEFEIVRILIRLHL